MSSIAVNFRAASVPNTGVALNNLVTTVNSGFQNVTSIIVVLSILAATITISFRSR